MPEPQRDLVRTLLNVLFLGLLAGGSLWLMRPFATAIIWATTIVVATWPVMTKLESWFRGRRAPAVVVMVVLLLLLVIGPFVGGVEAIVSNVDSISAVAAKLPSYQLPPAPSWLGSLPLVGTQALELWSEAASAGVPALLDRATPLLKAAAPWFASKIGTVGSFLVEFLLTVILCAVMYSGGETALAGIRAFVRRLAGNLGEDAVTLAGGAIRGVALGVVVTAIVQSVFAGIGLAIAGVPFAAPLTVLMFILAIAQIGPIPVLVLVVIWGYVTDGAGWGTFLLIWSLVAGTMDNVIRPVLIKRGADLPLLLIFAGVVGGLVSFGLIGIFVGPVLLAVSYTLLKAWVVQGKDAAPAA